MIERIWLIQESPGLKPDWFLDVKLFFMKNSNILSHNNLSKILPVIESNDIVRGFFNIYLSLFLWNGTTFARKVGNFPLSKEDWKINFRGLQIKVSHILIIWLLIISCPWDLFGSRFLIIFRISSVEKFIVARDLCVFLWFVWESAEVHCYYLQ